MEVRRARITNTYTIVHHFDKKLELGFVIQFDDGHSFGISFNEENKGGLEPLYLIIDLFLGPHNCFFDELNNKEILVLSGVHSGIAFANPYIRDKWVVVNADESRFYNKEEAQEILCRKSKLQNNNC